MLKPVPGEFVSRCYSSMCRSLIHHGLQSGVRVYSLRLNPILPLRQLPKCPSRRLTTVTVPPPGPNKSPRRLRILLSILLFGYLGRRYMSSEINLFAGPIIEPGSPEDIEITTSLNSRFDQLEIVKKLREDPDYTEWEPYGNFTEEVKKARLTSGCLRGSRGLSCQVGFNNIRLGYIMLLTATNYIPMFDSTCSTILKKTSSNLSYTLVTALMDGLLLCMGVQLLQFLTKIWVV